MKNLEFFEILGKSINFILIGDEKTEGSFQIKLIKSKYSSGNNQSNRIFIDGKIVKTKGSKVNYKCPVCFNDYTILAKRFISKQTLICRICKELSDSKRKKQSEYLKNSYKKYSKVTKIKTINSDKVSSSDYIKNSNHSFSLESSEFRENYYSNRIITSERFNRIKNQIHSVKGFKFKSSFIYYEHLKNNNQMKYSAYLHDVENDKFIHFDKISYICENCDVVFNTTRMPIERLNKHRILCRECSFCNNTFKIKSILNCLGDKVTYQSKPELDLINYLNDKNIPIVNGPRIKYLFDEKYYNYLVDFFMPSFNLMVEIKDPHIWHKDQVKSGRWNAKENSAVIYASDNGFEYKLVFSQYLNEFLKIF